MHRALISAASTVAAAVLTFTLAIGQPDAPAGRPRRGLALEAMIQSTDDEALTKFADEWLTPAYRESFARGALLEHLRKIRAACANFGGILAKPPENNDQRFTFMLESGPRSLLLKLEPEPPQLIVSMELEAGTPELPKGPAVAPITWDRLEQRLEEEAAAGFSGTVLVARAGKIALHRGYGLANRERKLPNTTETIYAIGSTPIDFTRGAILRLEQAGKLSTSDPITKFLKAVPEDKRGITIDHLLSGRSGLRNFHGEPADGDQDLAWIDRATAIRRILAKPLLFAPGSGEAHSHSAWVLLAAIVEIVSGQSYGDYLKTNFFEPAGMTHTGNHEDLAPLPDDAFAIGYEGNPVGKVNIPKYWGRTSWLVMGSGGMESTPHDLYLWNEAIRSGKTLDAAHAKRYFTGGVFMGGDDRGFMCLYTQGGPDLMILCSNAHSGPGDRASAVGKRLVELVQPSVRVRRQSP